jgi:hypothetical protein
MAESQSDGGIANAPSVGGQWYDEDYSYWDVEMPVGDPDFATVSGRDISLLLLLVLGLNIAWVIFYSTSAMRVVGLPIWAGWLPYIFTWLALLVPTFVGRRLLLRVSLERLALTWFLAGIAFSLVNHPYLLNGLLRFIGFLLVASVAYILLPANYSWDKIIRALRAIIILAVAISLGLSILFFPVITLSGTKAGGIFFNRNTMGFVAFLGLVCLGASVPKKRRQAIFRIGLLFFFGAMLLASRARASLACAFICGLLAFWHYRKRFSMWVIAIVTVVSLLAFGLMFTAQGQSLIDMILYKVEYRPGLGITDRVTSGRLSIWRSVRQLSRGRELNGLGIGSLASHYNVSSHSAYIALLGELGYIWFPGFALWVLLAILQAHRLLKYCSPEASTLVYTMFVMLVGIAVFNFFENALGGILGLPAFVFWVGAGALSNAAAQVRYQGYLDIT